MIDLPWYANLAGIVIGIGLVVFAIYMGRKNKK